jgi:glutathione peroxidase
LPYNGGMTTRTSSGSPSLYDFTVPNIRNTPVALADYREKVLLIVNVASRCMYTKQYTELQALYDRYRAQGLEVLGFPCDQFGHQEPGDATQISEFCTANFSITFPLFEKVEVNGDNAAPVFTYLKDAAPGLLGSRGIKWNFTKFLVSRGGAEIKRFAPRVTPEKLAPEIERLVSAHVDTQAPSAATP